MTITTFNLCGVQSPDGRFECSLGIDHDDDHKTLHNALEYRQAPACTHPNCSNEHSVEPGEWYTADAHQVVIASWPQRGSTLLFFNDFGDFDDALFANLDDPEGRNAVLMILKSILEQQRVTVDSRREAALSDALKMYGDTAKPSQRNLTGFIELVQDSSGVLRDALRRYSEEGAVVAVDLRSELLTRVRLCTHPPSKIVTNIPEKKGGMVECRKCGTLWIDQDAYKLFKTRGQFARRRDRKETVKM